MPAIIAVLAPGFTATPDRFAAAIDLARITALFTDDLAGGAMGSCIK